MDKSFSEFFAGVGLVRLGLEADGWSCKFANDISEKKQENYVQNFESEHFFCDDIWNIADNANDVPHTFLATASFPCTDLSLAGGRKGLAGKQSGSLHAFINILKKSGQKRPSLLMLENVRGFLTSNSGNDILNTVENLNKLNYSVDILEVDAKYFVPQSRPRVFLIALQKEIAEKICYFNQEDNFFSDFGRVLANNSLIRTKKIQDIISNNTHLNWGLFDIPQLLAPRTNISNIIEDIAVDSKLWFGEERTQKLIGQMSERHSSILNAMIKGSKVTYATVYRRVRAGKPMAEMRTDGIAGCLRTPKGGSSKQILIKAGNGKYSVRFLSPREYARLQGVPEYFTLPANATDAYFAMGDGVCVPLISWISENILSKAYDFHISESKRANQSIAA